MTETARTRMQHISLAVLSGVLLAGAFPPVPSGMTAFVALVPFLFLMERTTSLAQVFRYAYLTFLVLSAGTTWWISGWWGDDVWLKAAGVAVNMVHPFFFTVPVMLYMIVRRGVGSRLGTLSFPLIWTAWEWLFHLSETSFPWLLLANTQTYDIEKIQFISSTGAFGISFWIASVNAGVYVTLRRFLAGGRRLRDARLWVRVTVLLLAILLPEVHGRIVMPKDAAPGERLHIGIIQPDIDPYLKWTTGASAMEQLRALMRPYDSLVAAKSPDLVLLPETAIPFRIRQQLHHEEWQWLRAHIDSAGVPLLTGFPDLRFYFAGKEAPPSAHRIEGSEVRYQSFNATMLLQPDNATPQVYHKSRLTPMSERIPWIDTFPFLADMLTWGVGISSWGLGNDTTTFSLRTVNGSSRLWAMICYETLYPSFVAGFVDRGSQVLCVVTNDGWFGNSSGPYQLQRYTVLRAIETRRAVARCANNGISCFIDPWGRVTQETEMYTRTTLSASLPLRSDRTLYVRFGDWLPLTSSAASAFLLLLALYTSFNRKRQNT